MMIYKIFCKYSSKTERIRTEAATRGMSSKKGVLENFVKFTGKHMRLSLFFNKAQGISLQHY